MLSVFRLRNKKCSATGRDVRTADASACGRVRLRTQICKNSWDPQTDADGWTPKIRGRGLTRIINSNSALGKLTRWTQWADAIVQTDALHLSQPSDHALQLQPLIVLQWPSLPGSDALDTRLWLGPVLGIGIADCRYAGSGRSIN